MALLQIAEPGEAENPHQHRQAVGIDLGTTHSLIALVRDGVAHCLADESGAVLLPSVVCYGSGGQICVGRAPARQNEDAAQEPKNTIVSVKRLMGRGVHDVAHREALPYELLDGGGQVRLQTVQGVKTPVEVSAHILAALAARAHQQLDVDLLDAVITVPAYFDDAQRQATRDAARLAGLNTLRLLNEPTAAALAYGLDRAAEGVYVIYDLGGGTFDVSILRLSAGVFEVIASNGDSSLGGDDFDHCIYQWILQQADLQVQGKNEIHQLMSAARKAKEALSTAARAEICLTLDSGTALALTLEQTQLEAMTQHLVQKTLAPIKRALRDARLKPDDVQGVVLVGGATRMPHIRAAVATFFGKAPLTDLDPDQVVAFGAAQQASMLSGQRADQDWLLLDVLPLSLGVETMGGLAEKIIPRNATLPVARAQSFTTARDGQTAMRFHVVQGEREMVADCRSLAHFELRGIPPMNAGAARIEVRFEVDADGLLRVSAREQTQGVEAEVAVHPSYGLDEEEMAQMLRQGIAHASEDVAARQLAEQRVDAERLLEATRSALAADADLLNETERTRLDTAVAAVQAQLTAEKTTLKDLRRDTDALAQATETFAARRMNRSIRTALSGKTLDQISPVS